MTLIWTSDGATDPFTVTEPSYQEIKAQLNYVFRNGSDDQGSFLEVRFETGELAWIRCQAITAVTE